MAYLLVECHICISNLLKVPDQKGQMTLSRNKKYLAHSEMRNEGIGFDGGGVGRGGFDVGGVDAGHSRGVAAAVAERRGPAAAAAPPPPPPSSPPLPAASA